jgi:DNA-binding response OmpR family regulator
MEGIRVDGQRSVLIVDRSEETREVLQTALERRGCRIFTAGRPGRGLQLARQHHPHLIVLDLECESVGEEDFSAPFQQQSACDQSQLVLLGSLRRPMGLEGGEIVPKPYHYAALIRRIEELLGEDGSGGAH